MSMFGSISRLGYLGARGGALGAGSAKATRELEGSEMGEGAPRGLRGRGIVVVRALGGLMFARSLGAEVVGGITGLEEGLSIGCWTGADAASGSGATVSDGDNVALASVIEDSVASGRIGATGAGPGTGGMKGCLGSVGGRGEDDLRNAPAAFTSSKILLLVGVTGVGCCVVFAAALGADVSFFVL